MSDRKYNLDEVYEAQNEIDEKLKEAELEAEESDIRFTSKEVLEKLHSIIK